MYAIVDIETTGGYAEYHRITEIAICHHDGKGVTGFFHTLINPGRNIPAFITGLTGITADMVARAPTFEEVAEDIFRLLDGRVFVAHNAHFDYSFLKKEFEGVGIAWRAKKLCTVRLSRKLLPGLRSYSLGSLAEVLGINLINRHRAGGDVEATAQLFTRLLETDREGYVERLLRHNSGETILPPNLPRHEFDRLPAAPGIYYFLDGRKRVIYIGKAANIKKRVAGHFTGTALAWSQTRIRQEIHHVDFEPTGCEMLALIREAEEIRRLWPRYNQAQKHPVEEWGLFTYEDQQGYLRIVVNKVVRNSEPFKRFYTKGEAWNYVWQQVDAFELCPRLAGLQDTRHACYYSAQGRCRGACIGHEHPEPYNQRVRAMMEEAAEEDLRPVAWIGRGRTEKERTVIITRNHRVHYGFISKRTRLVRSHALIKRLRPAMDVPAVHQIIHSYIVHPRDMEMIILDE